MCELIDSYTQALLDGLDTSIPADPAVAERRVRRALAQLPTLQREALALSYGLDAAPLNNDAVAKRLGLSPRRIEQLLDAGIVELGFQLFEGARA